MQSTKYLAPAILMLVGVAPAYAGLIVTDNQTADALVTQLLSGSSGITFSNAQIVGSPDGAQNGAFSGGNSAGLGFDSGIVLSSGRVSALPLAAPDTDYGADYDMGQPGDAELNTLATGETYDASVLKFDFVPTGNQIQFQYVFGSTEYNQFVNSTYNDVFGFFVNGVNEALIPGTTTPVSINNVNCGQASGPTSAGSPGNPPVTNCGDFINNRLADDNTGANELIDLGGFTHVFSLVANVNPNVTNTMYIAVADVSDHQLDSAVFLQGGTLSVCGGPGQPACGGGGGSTAVPEPGTLALAGIGALGLLFIRRRRMRVAAGLGAI